VPLSVAVPAISRIPPVPGASLSFSQSSNSASDFGGGIFNDIGGTLTLTNSTFSGNSSTTLDGGAIVNGGMLTVTNSTFSGNSASVVGGIFYFNGNVTLKGTILAREFVSGGNCANTITDAGYNVSDDNTCGFISGTSFNNARHNGLLQYCLFK
jgi:hypothetical protein